jgi:ribulose-5-phosphate 4-epimerase/fuculose-1-phosphate aldolase
MSMLQELKEKVLEATGPGEKGLVIYTWGNVSGIDRDSGHVVIKQASLYEK